MNMLKKIYQVMDNRFTYLADNFMEILLLMNSHPSHTILIHKVKVR